MPNQNNRPNPNRSNASRPAAGRPTGDRPSGNRPSGNRPSGSKPSSSTRPRRHKTDPTYKTLGLGINFIYILSVLIFVATLFYINTFPTKYILVAVGVLAFVGLICAFLVRNDRPKKRFWIGFCLEILFIGLMVFGDIEFLKTANTIKSGTGITTESTVIGSYVKVDDPAENIGEAANYKFGILAMMDRENVNNTIAAIEKELGVTLDITPYDGLTQLADGLRNGEVQAIIVNTGLISTYQDFEGYETFESEIKVLYNAKYEEEINEEEIVVDETNFCVFISGIDTYGNVSAKARSDVNILAFVNTESKQILLLTTPRDYYVPLSISNGKPDKLTHAGIYGIDVSMDTLEMIYDCQVDYYFRLNFTGFQDIIDALGGVTVDSDYDFKAISGEHFVKGENTLNGEQALAFARERKAFADGDFQRGRDQMKVITAVINKATSPSILTRYNDLLNSMDGTFQTSISYDTISSLVKMQLNDNAKWNIVSYSVVGTGAWRECYSAPGQDLAVVVPDENKVNTAKELIKQIQSGQVITKPED